MFARVYGAVRPADVVGRREDRRWMLRNHGGSHQAHSSRSALATTSDQEAERHDRRAGGKSQGTRKSAGGRKKQAGREAGRRKVRGVRRDSTASRSGCIQGNRRRQAV